MNVSATTVLLLENFKKSGHYNCWVFLAISSFWSFQFLTRGLAGTQFLAGQASRGVDQLELVLIYVSLARCLHLRGIASAKCRCIVCLECLVDSFFRVQSSSQQSGAVEACWAHIRPGSFSRA